MHCNNRQEFKLTCWRFALAQTWYNTCIAVQGHRQLHGLPRMQQYICNVFGLLPISISAKNASLQSCADYYTAYHSADKLSCLVAVVVGHPCHVQMNMRSCQHLCLPQLCYCRKHQCSLLRLVQTACACIWRNHRVSSMSATQY